MALREAVTVMLKSICFAVANYALSSIEVDDDVEEELVEAPPSYVMPPSMPPDGIGEEPTDHQLWQAEQEMLRRVRPGSPLIDPDYDKLSRDIVQPMDLS